MSDSNTNNLNYIKIIKSCDSLTPVSPSLKKVLDVTCLNFLDQYYLPNQQNLPRSEYNEAV